MHSFIQKFAVTGALFLLSHHCLAQNLRLEQVNYTGVVDRIAGNIIDVKTENGNIRAELLLPNANQTQLAVSQFGATRINVRGRESTSYLKKGMTVRFEANVVRNVIIKDPITEVTLISNQEFTQLGMELAGGALPDRRDADADREDNNEKKMNARDRRNANRNAPQRMIVTGQVRMSNDEKLMVEIPDPRRGRKPKAITAQWGKDPIVRLDAQELTYVGKGDRITVSGFTIRGNQMMATTVEVDHINPEVRNPDGDAAAGAFAKDGGAGDKKDPGLKAGPGKEGGDKEIAGKDDAAAGKKERATDSRKAGRIYKIN